MINKFKQITDTEKASILVIAFIIIRAFNITINETIQLTASNTIIIKLLIILLFFILNFFLITLLNPKKRILFIFSDISVCFLMILTYFRYPSIGFNLFLSYGWVIISFIPLLFALQCITDKQIFYNHLKWSSYIISICCTFIYFFHIRKLSTNLVFSYTLLFPYLLHIVELLYKKNYKIVFLFLIESYMLLTYGARGTLVCSVLFIIIIINKIGIKNFKYIFTVCIALLILYEILYISGFFTSLYEHFLAQGKYLRVLDLISKGNFFNNNGRFDIYNNYFTLILEKPLLGWGLGADLFIGFFPHNIIIELFFNFGLIMGFVFIFLIFIMVLYCFKKSNDCIFQILFGCGMLPLFFSFSYLEWMYFWVLLGYILHENKKFLINFINKVIHKLN